VNFTAPTGTINEKTDFAGNTVGGDTISLRAYSTYPAGEGTIRLLYSVQDGRADHRHQPCQVGASPEPFTKGCLTAIGTISLEGINSAQLSYVYDPLKDNKNGRTLAGFSTGAEKKMALCDNCPYVDYDKFYTYYGHYDYGHQWVTAAFDKRPTDFAFGNADFASYSDVAANEAIRIGTAMMNVWMYVIREFEDALDDCEKGCATDECNADKVNAWDEGVAFYAGSLEGLEGTERGNLPYALAEELCADFHTCTGTGKSHVNEQILDVFDIGLGKLLEQQCAETRVEVERIVELMTVPLVQATLRSAYHLSLPPTPSETLRGQAAAYAATVLPLVHNCSAADAEIIYENLKYGRVSSSSSDTDFQAVKAAFERNYPCLGISCEDVGGLWNERSGSYYPGAEACQNPSGGQVNVGLVVGASVAGLVFLFLVIFVSRLLVKKRKERTKP